MNMTFKNGKHLHQGGVCPHLYQLTTVSRFSFPDSEQSYSYLSGGGTEARLSGGGTKARLQISKKNIWFSHHIANKFFFWHYRMMRFKARSLTPFYSYRKPPSSRDKYHWMRRRAWFGSVKLKHHLKPMNEYNS